MSSLYPTVKWAERNETVFITIDLQNIENEKLNITEEQLTFSGMSSGKTYEFSLKFPEKIDTEKSKTNHNRVIQILLHKQEAKRWHKITTDSGKTHWLKCDWNQWVDSDDEDDMALDGKGYNGMDFGQFNNFNGMDPGMFGGNESDNESDGSEGDLDDILKNAGPEADKIDAKEDDASTTDPISAEPVQA